MANIIATPITILPMGASGPGALAGFEAACGRCGLRMTHTHKLSLQMDVADHLRYHLQRYAELTPRRRNGARR